MDYVKDEVMRLVDELAHAAYRNEQEEVMKIRELIKAYLDNFNMEYK